MTESAPHKPSLSAAAQAEFCQVLLEHLRAALPVGEALASLSRDARSRRLRRVAARLRAEVVERGLSLADAMEATAAPHPAFPEAFVALVRAGERTGALADVLDCHLRLSFRQKRLLAQLRRTVLYPMLSVWAALAILAALEIVVVPRMVEIYKELGCEIPGLTQWVIDISDVLINKWWLPMVPVGICLAWQIDFLLRRDFGGATWRALLFLPPLKTRLRHVNSAAFLRMAGGLLRHGVPLPEALGLARSALIGEEAKRDARHAQEMAESGATPDQVSWFYLFVPDEARELLHSRQPAADPAPAMEDLADYYEKRVEKPDWGILRLIEPIPLFLVVILFGVMIWACYIPFFGGRGDLR